MKTNTAVWGFSANVSSVFCITVWAGVDIKGALEQVQFLTFISHVCCILQRLLAHMFFLKVVLSQECRHLVQLK